MDRSKIKILLILFFSCYLVISCIASKANSEETTTNNLISQDFSTGWSGTATQRHGNSTVAAVNNTYIKSDDVSLKDDANLTEAQLQDGFTSNHTFKYWHWNNYNSTVTSTVTVTGADGEATTQIRTYSSTGCGYINCGSYQSGSDNLSISRSTQTDFDINVRYDFTDTSNSTSHYSVDLKQPSLTVTYESEPIDQSIQDEINEIFEDLQEEVFEDIEEFTFEEETFTFNEEPQFEMEVEMEMETFTFAEEFVEDFFMEMDEEFFMEAESMEFEDGPMFEFVDTEMEEIYEETNEIVATFLPMVSEEEEFSPTETFTTETFEEEVIEEEPMMTETFQEEEMIEEEPMMTETFEEEEMPEESTEMVEEEVMEEENTEMAKEEEVEEESTEMVEAENEETFKEEAQEEKSTSETTTASTVQSKKLAKQKKIQQKKAIVKNLAKIMDKVDKDVKDIAKNLAIKNIIKMEAMTSEQASLAMYQNAVFYKPKDIYLDQLNIFDPRQLYPNTSLASYVDNDKMVIKAKKLNKLNIKKQKLLMELEVLKNE
jgi:hypothetical protein